MSKAAARLQRGSSLSHGRRPHDWGGGQLAPPRRGRRRWGACVREIRLGAVRRVAKCTPFAELVLGVAATHHAPPFARLQCRRQRRLGGLKLEEKATKPLKHQDRQNSPPPIVDYGARRKQSRVSEIVVKLRCNAASKPAPGGSTLSVGLQNTVKMQLACFVHV